MGVDVADRSGPHHRLRRRVGDVFGDDVLSRSIQLVAAFDHRHIFLDPRARRDRELGRARRMLALPRTPPRRLRQGADFPMAAACLPRSEGNPAVPASAGHAGAGSGSGIDPRQPDHRDPEGGMSTCCEYGGISTYIKASADDVAVGDPPTMPWRIDGADVRARRDRRGADLGCTRRAGSNTRCAVPMAGQAADADFIDSSTRSLQRRRGQHQDHPGRSQRAGRLR